MAWTSALVEELIVNLRQHRGDFTETEVKLGAGGCPNLGATLCAFGNMPGGGTIVVGLDENDGFAVVGVPDTALIEAGIASQARTAVTPPVQVSFEEADIDGATLVIATVAGLPSMQRPCRHQGNAYLRQADGDYVMSEQEIQQVLALRERPRYDAQPVDGTSVENLDQGLVREFLIAARSTSRRLASQPDDEVLRRKTVLAPDGVRLTLAGLYALGSYPQQFAPSLSITAAVQLDPRGGDRSRDLVHLDGPIPDLLEGAMEWVRRNTHTTVRFGPDGHGRDETEIPMVAVRELVANALVHRDLGLHTQSKRVEIRLADDRLVITSPGGLYGVSRQQLGTPARKSAVNEFLYDITKLSRTSSGARVIEGEGGGIREVQRLLRLANMKQPTFVDKGISFAVIVPRHSLLSMEDVAWLAEHDKGATLSDTQRQIVTSMRYGQGWNNALVREEFAPIDSRDARGALQGLVSAGFAVTSGERGQTIYTIEDRYRTSVAATPPATIVIRAPHSQTPAEQDALPGDPAEGDGPTVTRNGLSIWHALKQGPLSLEGLVDATGLSHSQVRYALGKLEDSGHIDVDGGQGVHSTMYRQSR